MQEWYPNSDTERVFCYQLGKKMLVVSERKKNSKKAYVASVSAVLLKVIDVKLSMNSPMTAGCETSTDL